MTPMDGIVDDMANIKPMLDRATKIQRQVNGELQWRVIVYDGALGKQVERLAVGLTEARRLREVLRANVAAAKPGIGPAHAASRAKPGQRHAGASVQALTVNQWAPLFLRYYAVTRDGSPRPATSMESASQRLERYILPFIGDRTMESLTLAELEDMVANLRKVNGDPLAQSSKESVSSTLKTVWTLAKRRGVISVNAAADLPTSWGGAAASSRRLIKPSLTAVDALAGAMGELGDVVLLLAFTGMRWEEASGAWTSDVDLEQRLLSCQRVSPVVRGKRVPPGTTMKSRHARRDILIVDQAVEPLQRLLARAGSASGAEPVLVTGERGRGPLHYRTWRNKLSEAQAATGLTYTAHQLRHVYASILIDSGMEDAKIARYMGHSNANYTRALYGHWFPEDSRADADQLSAAIGAIRARESAIAKGLELSRQ